MEKFDFYDVRSFLYACKNDADTEKVINKYILKVLNGLSNPDKEEQGEAIKCANEFITIIKKKPNLKIEADKIVSLLLETNNLLIRNVTTLFVKQALGRIPPEQRAETITKLYDAQKIVPKLIDAQFFTLAIECNKYINPEQFIVILNAGVETCGYSKLIQGNSGQFIPNFVKNNINLFKKYEKLYAILMTENDIEVVTPKDFNAEVISKIAMGISQSGENIKCHRAFGLLLQLDYKLPIDYLKSNLGFTDGILLLEKQIDIYDTMQPHTKDIALNLATRTTSPQASSCLRALLKKYHTEFENDLQFFKMLLNSEADNSWIMPVLYMFSLFVNSDLVRPLIEEQLTDGNRQRAIRLLKNLYQFSAPRPRLFACVLFNDGTMIEDCRLLLYPYTHIIKDGFRTPIDDPTANPPSTSELFFELLQMPNLKRFLCNSNSTRAVNELFRFAATCKVTLPLPFDFIIQEFSNCPNAALNISAFLYYVTTNSEFQGELTANIVDQCIDVMKSENDQEIIEAISGFLKWSNANIDKSEVTTYLSGSKKIAFLAHFGEPIDECIDMLNNQSQSAFAKRLIMVLAKRNLLNEKHFEILFKKFSIDSYGIEILSVISKNNKDLSMRIVECLFNPPLISTERVEVIISGAKSLVEIIDDEKFFLKKIDDGLKQERSRRNSSIFLLYLVNHKIPENLWYVTRSLLFCSGAENGVVRTAGILGLPLLYSKLQTEEQKKIFDDAFHGRNKPSDIDLNPQSLTGLPRSQTISAIVKFSNNKLNTFLNIMTGMIENEFLIFTGINIPKESVKPEDKERLAALFYIESFNPDEDRAKSFRKLYNWATDGGKLLSLESVINSMNPEANDWKEQQTNIGCLKDVISRMSVEQSQFFFEKVTKILLRIAYGPVAEFQILASDVLDKLVTKLGTNLPDKVTKQLLDLIIKSVDSQLMHLTVLSMKWCSQLSKNITTKSEALAVFECLFHAISSQNTFIDIPKMLASDSWANMQRTIFKCSELALNEFFDMLMEMYQQSSTMETVRYVIYYCLDSCVRSPNKTAICQRLEENLNQIFLSCSEEKHEQVIPIMTSFMQHALSCMCIYYDDNYCYDDLLVDLFVNKERPDLVAKIIEMMCTYDPQHLRQSITPLILLASCLENSLKEFVRVLKEEIVLRVEVNSDPIRFCRFLIDKGINGNLMMKPAGAKALKKVFMVMNNDSKNKILPILLEISDTLDGRLYTSKEKLIDCITLSLNGLPEIPQKLIDTVIKQCSRQKSVFRAAAANCVLEMKKKGIKIDENKFGEQLLQMAKDGTGIAVETAALCAEGDWVQKIADVVYSRVEKADKELVPNLICAIQNLKEHKAPDNFNMDDLIAKLDTIE
ncbi:hypothetical protein TVAG_461850 [Trichomonas vaginalis G3]|uniref:Proteasome component Ecm29 N-terminal domain-containing protein n=1 Tax=Trichomonas vaginalis (strain ATCC PRA-98 / G3) TaxID=412133 RepID=A2FI58_TRIV3|nr:proteasome adapter and scaffold protein ECM29 family [Trichomonas vaginalis G3]EAX95411.1 hypothetical protein TVAG_461850 [Trichomonas vaginalis G3]KAI5524122.1 proteasome adapter and scaffold protein ECM29 family [Trichomonas vaginalis G3]|eukprot:XP_001308341.1 hypothetical protein [Trichomonas vaginalis G3]